MRHWTTAFVLTATVLGGCGKQEEIPDFAKPIVSSTPSSVVTASPKKYPTQWLGGKTLTVAPGVHVLGELYPSVAFAIETKEGVILIDTGGDEGGFDLRECMLSVGLTAKQVRYILITHGHYDHVIGSNKMRKMSEAVVCAGRDDCQVLRAADEDAMFSLFPKHVYSGDPIEVDRELDDGDEIVLGEVKIRTIGAPGHTPGSVCYLLEKDGQRILFSGDVIASLNFGPATYPAHLAPRFRGNAKSFLNTINRLLEMEPPDLLLTSHPQQQTRLQSIRMDQESWDGLLVPAKKELEQVISRHQQDGADFLDGVTKEIESGLYYLGELENTAVYCIVHGEQMIVINAPGGDLLAEHLSTQLESLGLPAREPNVVLLTSDDVDDRSGLQSLASHPKVVAPPAAIESLQAKGIEIISHEELKGIVPFPIETIAVDNTLSYVLDYASKQIVITPDAPRKITLVWTNRQNGRKTYSGLPQTHELETDLGESPEFASAYHGILRELTDYSPDIWLTAMPLTGQNANLYDDDWQTIIEQNKLAAKKFTQGR